MDMHINHAHQLPLTTTSVAAQPASLQQRPPLPAAERAPPPLGSATALPPAHAAQAAAAAFGHVVATSRAAERSTSAPGPLPAVRMSVDSNAIAAQTSSRPPVSRSKGFEDFNGKGPGYGLQGYRECAMGGLYSIDELAGGSSLATQEFLVHKGTVGAGADSLRLAAFSCRAPLPGSSFVTHPSNKTRSIALKLYSGKCLSLFWVCGEVMTPGTCTDKRTVAICIR